jgi:hypothetical protein
MLSFYFVQKSETYGAQPRSAHQFKAESPEIAYAFCPDDKTTGPNRRQIPWTSNLSLNPINVKTLAVASIQIYHDVPGDI